MEVLGYLGVVEVYLGILLCGRVSWVQSHLRLQVGLLHEILFVLLPLLGVFGRSIHSIEAESVLSDSIPLDIVAGRHLGVQIINGVPHRLLLVRVLLLPVLLPRFVEEVGEVLYS